MLKSLDEITTDDLVEITRLAGLFFTPSEIAFMLEFDSSILKAFNSPGKGKYNNDIYNSYHGGRLQGEIDLRTGIMKMAKAGSSPAQTMALDLLKASRIKLMDDGA